MQVLLSFYWVFYLFFPSIFFHAEKPDAAISLGECKRLYVGISNPVHIVAQQKEPVRRAQVSAEVEVYDSIRPFPVEVTGDNGEFIIKPKHIGRLTLKVQTQTGLYTKQYHVGPIKPVAALRMIQEHGTMKDEIFKVQKIIIPIIQCCGFDARCGILEFSLIKIGHDGTSIKVKNIGGKFNDHTKAIIQSARPGDIYWFRNIVCRCASNEEDTEATELSIEIE